MRSIAKSVCGLLVAYLLLAGCSGRPAVTGLHYTVKNPKGNPIVVVIHNTDKGNVEFKLQKPPAPQLPPGATVSKSESSLTVEEQGAKVSWNSNAGVTSVLWNGQEVPKG